MKLNLLLNGDNPRSGYLNLDPFTKSGDSHKVLGDIYNLDEHVDDAECDEIVAMDVADYIPANEITGVIEHWVKKLRRGGTITVGGIDLREIAKAIVRQELDLGNANILLYGEQSLPWQYRKATMTLQHLITLFELKGLKIIQKRITDYFYHVKAERP